MEWSFVFFLNSALLGVGLAMDAFSVSMANGLHDPKMGKDTMCRIAGTFGVFQAVMPMTGWICVHTIVELFSSFETFIPWIALALLGYIGGKMLIEGIKGEEAEEAAELSAGALFMQGVATSIDALAARSRHRLCATVQLGDTGLIPGSGVGNHRKAVNARTLGVPVIALGVPTVIDGAALCGGEDAPPTGLFVTPQDIDRRVRELGRLIGYGVTLALQPGLTPEDAAALLG